VIKQIDIQQMSEEERKETLREAKILEVLSHPNIVRFREVYKTKKGKLCIVMDFADGGDLQSRIKDKHKQRQQVGRLEYFPED
jgi:NIMA (never in mitosis gene a)-related kinase 1/4/5